MSEITDERLREIVEFPYDSQEQRDIARALLAAREEIARLARERDEARATCEARGRLLDEHRRDCAWRFRAEKAEARVARLEAVAEAAREVIHASEHGTGHDDVRAEDALIAALRALAGQEPAPTCRVVLEIATCAACGTSRHSDGPADRYCVNPDCANAQPEPAPKCGTCGGTGKIIRQDAWLREVFLCPSCAKGADRE